MKRLRAVATLAALLYAVVVETSAFRHHGVACSPKAPGHCETCLRGPDVSRVETGFRLDQPALVDLGGVQPTLAASPRTVSILPRAGRAPPA